MGKEHKTIKNHGTDKEETGFLPGQETEEQFSVVLPRLSEWMKAGIVDLEIDADGDVCFELPSEMAKLLGTELPAGLTGDEVRGIVQKEVPALLSSRLKSDPKEWLETVLPKRLHGKIDTMVERSKEAFSLLVDKNLKERLLLRKATPAYVSPSIRQVVMTTYHVESGEGEKVDVPVACLEFRFTKPRSGYAFEINLTEPRVVTSRKDDIKVAADLHKDDIDDLIKKLKKIRLEMISEK
jgi:hypothetical protein